MAALEDANELTMADATKRGVAALVQDAELGNALVITRHHRPVAAVIGVGRLAEIEQATADLRDLALVLTRSVTDTGRRTSLDKVLAKFGHTRESIAEVQGDE